MFKLYQRRLEKEQILAELDTKINELYAKKAELEVETEKLSLTLASAKNVIELTSQINLLQGKIATATETLESLKIDAKITADSILKKLLDKYPNIKAEKLNIIAYFKSIPRKISFLDLELIIDSVLTSFAIEHGIDPLSFQELMYCYNEAWHNRFEELQKKYDYLRPYSYENEFLFNNYIILVDNNK